MDLIRPVKKENYLGAHRSLGTIIRNVPKDFPIWDHGRALKYGQRELVTQRREIQELTVDLLSGIPRMNQNSKDNCKVCDV